MGEDAILLEHLRAGPVCACRGGCAAGCTQGGTLWMQALRSAALPSSASLNACTAAASAQQ